VQRVRVRDGDHLRRVARDDLDLHRAASLPPNAQWDPRGRLGAQQRCGQCGDARRSTLLRSRKRPPPIRPKARLADTACVHVRAAVACVRSAL
jgi:bacterioferritin-associated ferredoxin